MGPADEEEHFRLFVAIELPERVKDGIEEAQNHFRRSVPGPAVKWTRRDHFHLTLRFLGRVEAQRVPDLVGALRTACSKFSPLSMRLEGIGFFPNGRRPRVIWVGVVDDSDRLAALALAVEQVTRGFTREEEPEPRFSGHVTLGRVKEAPGSRAGKLAETAAAFGGRPKGSWVASETVLMRSQLGSGGAIHTRLATFALGAVGGTDCS